MPQPSHPPPPRKPSSSPSINNHACNSCCHDKNPRYTPLNRRPIIGVLFSISPKRAFLKVVSFMLHANSLRRKDGRNAGKGIVVIIIIIIIIVIIIIIIIIIISCCKDRKKERKVVTTNCVYLFYEIFFLTRGRLDILTQTNRKYLKKEKKTEVTS